MSKLGIFDPAAGEPRELRPGEPLVAASADASEGAMIALIPEDPQALAAPHEGALPADDLHVTLLFLTGDADELDDAQLAEAEELTIEVARTPFPDTEVFGSAIFNEHTESACCVLLVRADDAMVEAHEGVRDNLAWAAHSFPAWLPHITLGYRADMSSSDWDDLVGYARGLAGTPIRWAAARLAVGGSVQDHAIEPPEPPEPEE